MAPCSAERAEAQLRSRRLVDEGVAALGKGMRDRDRAQRLQRWWSLSAADVRVAVGAQLCAVVHLTPVPLWQAAALGVAVHGAVRRVASRPDGTYGVGVACTRHRFQCRGRLGVRRIVPLPPVVPEKIAPLRDTNL